MSDHERALDGRVIIVTGASRGIGKGLALGYAAEGAAVVCAARSVRSAPSDLPGTIEETVDAITSAGGRAIAVPCDIGIERDLARARRAHDRRVRTSRFAHEQRDGTDTRIVRRVDRRDVGRVDARQRAQPLPAHEAGRAAHDRAGRREHREHVVGWRRPLGDSVHATRLRHLRGGEIGDGALLIRARAGARRPRDHRERADDPAR